MATSTCIKCGNTSFELKEFNPTGSRYKLSSIQCSSCGGVVGVVEFFNVAFLVKELAKKMGFTI